MKVYVYSKKEINFIETAEINTTISDRHYAVFLLKESILPARFIVSFDCGNFFSFKELNDLEKIKIRNFIFKEK